MVKDRVCVIGSNCFTGAHLVKKFLSEGAEVVGVNRSAEPPIAFLPYQLNSLQDHYRFYQMDLNHDLNDLMATVHDFQPEYVINLAAQGMVGQSWQTPEDWFQTNTVANIKLHDELRKCKFLKKYLHTSTPEVYGNIEGEVKEHTHYQPSTPYGVSKAAADMSLMTFLKAYNFPVVFTRAANVYGPCQQLYRIIPRTILYFLTGKTLELHGGGNSIRSFIHIDDIAKATSGIVRKADPGSIYHLATPEYVSIRDLVEHIAQKLDINFHDHVKIVGDRLGKDQAYILNCKKAKQDIGWESEISLDKGIDDTIQWVKAHFETLKDIPIEYQHRK